MVEARELQPSPSSRGDVDWEMFGRGQSHARTPIRWRRGAIAGSSLTAFVACEDETT